TPLDPGETAGLIPSHITTQQQLNEWELANILEGERWAFGRRHKDLLSIQFVGALHKRMFGNTWSWAGMFRNSEKNIGVAPEGIQPELLKLCKDVKAQLEHKSQRLDEIAARFHHRLVSIHPFANGNGRLARTMTDLLLVQNGAERFTWGAGNLVAAGSARQRYLDALRQADARNYGPLFAFVRSQPKKKT
ncbi:MAG TPA: mobile mystery protein B, partial [Acidobacteriota bacterium]|nr:mobile mystery protein B [Acidobacteriota bacterium]